MANPERQHQTPDLPSTQAELEAALAEIDNQLELADENENPIERDRQRNKLLEAREEIEAQEPEVPTIPPLTNPLQ